MFLFSNTALRYWIRHVVVFLKLCKLMISAVYHLCSIGSWSLYLDCVMSHTYSASVTCGVPCYMCICCFSFHFLNNICGTHFHSVNSLSHSITFLLIVDRGLYLSSHHLIVLAHHLSCVGFSQHCYCMKLQTHPCLAEICIPCIVSKNSDLFPLIKPFVFCCPSVTAPANSNLVSILCCH